MKSTQNKTPLQLTSDLKTKQAFNTLWRAAIKGDLDLARKLIRSGADVNLATEYEHITPLINVTSTQAVKNKHILMVKLLLDNGASPDLIDAKGKSALDYARLTRDEKICRLLESAQSQTTMKSSSYDTMERIQQLKSETQPPKEDEYEEDEFEDDVPE